MSEGIARWSGRILSPVRRLLLRLEMDLAVLYVVASWGWQLFTAPLTLIFIARYFSPEAQGFYFTFLSLLALQSFVELGFQIVIINVTSHEWAKLGLDADGRIVGDPEALSRLASLGRLVARWYAIAAGVFIVVVGIGGFLFFSSKTDSGVWWQGPWLSLVLVTGGLLGTLPFIALLEGCNQVVTVNQSRFARAVLGTLALWIGLALGWGLWSATAFAVTSLLRDFYLLGFRYRRFFESLRRPPVGPKVNWRREIWPLQWRLGVQGILSFFMLSLFNPVMFHYHGPVIAGQMGMTHRLVTVIQSLALAWVTTKVARFGMMIARRDYDAFDQFWRRAVRVSIIVVVLGSAAIWMIVYGLNHLNSRFAERLLDPLPTALFLVAAIFLHLIQCEAIYMRAHKREPFLLSSVVCGSTMGFLVWLLGSRFGPIGAVTAYLAVLAFLAFPWTTLMWSKARTEWREA